MACQTVMDDSMNANRSGQSKSNTLPSSNGGRRANSCWQTTLSRWLLRNQHKQQHLAGAGAARYGHFTRILLANCEPWPTNASEARNERSKRWLDGKAEPLGRTRDTAHCAGAWTSLTGSFSSKPKSMKNSGSKMSISRFCARTGFLNGRVKCKVRMEFA